MSRSDCIFCKIVSGEIPSRRILENDEFVAFHDVQPQAKVHALVVPRRHHPSLVDAAAVDGPEWLGLLLKTGVEAARVLGIDSSGFRSVINTGPEGGQTVFHLHLHIIGGEKLRGGMA